MPQFAEHIHLKNQQIQDKFFKLLEFIVFQLNFVPVKELVSMAQLLKTFNSTECTKICLQTLLNILKHNNAFKDVFRDVGLLEGLSNNLRNYTQDYLSDCESKGKITLTLLILIWLSWEILCIYFTGRG